MRQVKFSSIPVGAEFKADKHGSWHLKIDTGRGLWRSSGVESAPYFLPDELVWID
jgi:hypothetical protein